MTNNGIVNIHGKQYVTVAKRLQDAHKDEKLQGVKTEVIQFDPVIVIKATVIIAGIEYTGISSINTGSATGNTEKTSPYEVAETSAVGRALAFAGYETELGIASAEEVHKAIDAEERYENRTAEQTTTNKAIEYQAGKTHFCETHQTPMKQREYDGSFYWDHRRQIEGVWNKCQGAGFKADKPREEY